MKKELIMTENGNANKNELYINESNLLDELKILLSDYYIADIFRNGNKIIVSFLDGQMFTFSVKKCADKEKLNN